MFQDFNHTPSSVSTPENTAHMAKSYAHIHEQSAIGRGLGDQNSYIPENPLHHQIGTGDIPVTTDISLMNSAIDDKRIQVPTIGVPSTSEHAEIGPSIILSQSKDSESPQIQSAISQSSSHAHEKQLVEEDHTPHTYNLSGSNNPILLTLPPSVLSLPYDICLRRKDLDEQTTKGLAMFTKVKGTLGIETRARDSSLIETFSDPRELIFVVDNGWTMSKHWPIVTFVAQTLAKNAAGLDKSGFDLKFTVDGHTHNQECLKGDSGRKKLKKALKAAWPEYKENNHVTTNMARVFKNIFEDWNRSGQPATTLLVLTDGVWSNTDLDTLNQTILDIAKKDQSHAGNRHFSIQFIRFGDEEAQRTLLQTLDDSLCAKHKLRDIIDHCSWRAKVDKMFKGSIEGYLDEQDSEEEPILYDYKKLVDLFEAFNRAEDAVLSPTNSIFRSPSRISHRSSISLSNSVDWPGRR